MFQITFINLIFNLNYPTLDKDTYPVQRVCVEGVARLLPVLLSFRLETDFTDGENIALVLFLTMANLLRVKQALDVWSNIALSITNQD